ncbi:MAG TPA: plastocyanin/azurin family copper-binding protein [Solirubrobacteraceae bacterium]|nr:plastocyanin/azurin family copper-binding protein [Solirubrobacteraceae bacterium]
MNRSLLLATLATTIALAAGCGSSSTSTTSSTTATTAAVGASGGYGHVTSTTSTTTSTTTGHAGAPAAGNGRTVSLAANPEGQLKYSATSLTAGAGAVSIDFTNMSPLAHNLTVASSSGAVLGATPTFQGGSKTLTLNLAPGTYTFYCTVPGHRMAGMEGKLVVR